MHTGEVKQFPLEEEYKKKNGITPQDISKLREWLQGQPHLPGEYITDLDLILAYHCCGRSSEVSKQLLDLHFTLRTLFINLFKDRVFEKKIENVLNNMLMIPLKVRSHNGYAVIYSHLLDFDAKNFVFPDTMRTLFMTLDLWQYEEGTWPGFMIVVDMEGVTMSHISKLDLQTLREFFYYVQEALLLNLKGLHYLNAPSFMDKVLTLLRPFMKKHLLDMVHVHEVGSKSLEKFLPMEALPKDAGGEYMTFAEGREVLLTRFKSNQEFYRLENRKRVDESKRPGKPKTITDIFGGVEGSFKKLDID